MTVVAIVGNPGNTLYEIIFYVHVLVAIVGYGTVVLNGLFAANAQGLDLPQRFGAQSTKHRVDTIAEYFIYANFAAGLLLVFLADENSVVGFDQTWVSLSMLLWIVAIGISHGLLIPSEKKYLADLEAQVGGAEPGSTGVDLAALDKRMAASGAGLNVLLAVILYLMIWKPGA